MKPNTIIGLMAVGIIVPSTAIASTQGVLAKEVRVKTANIEAVSRSDGSVYINTGGNTVSVPRRRSSPYWNSWGNWNFPWQHYSKYDSGCRQSSYQSTRQTTSSGRRIVHNSSYNHSCN